MENKKIQQKKFESAAQKAIINTFLASVELRKTFEKVCAKENITLPQFNILRILRGVHPKGHPRSEVIKRMVDNSDVTRLIDRLEKMNLVKRKKDNLDKRLAMTVITGQGLKLLERLSPHFEKAHKEITITFSESELQMLSSLLEKIINHNN